MVGRRRVRQLARRRRRAEADPGPEVDDGPTARDDHQEDRPEPDAARHGHLVAVASYSDGVVLEHFG